MDIEEDTVVEEEEIEEDIEEEEEIEEHGVLIGEHTGLYNTLCIVILFILCVLFPIFRYEVCPIAEVVVVGEAVATVPGIVRMMAVPDTQPVTKEPSEKEYGSHTTIFIPPTPTPQF